MSSTSAASSNTTSSSFISNSNSNSAATQRIGRLLQQISHNNTDSSHYAAPNHPLDKVGNSSRFFYTVDSGILSEEQRQFYETNGYLLFRRLVPQSELDKYAQRFVQICNDRESAPPTMTIMRDIHLAKKKKDEVKGEENITKLQDWCDDDVFFSFCAHPAVTRIASGIVGDDLRAMHTMLINKPPDLGQGSSRHPPHQDLWYFPFRPAQRVVCGWTAMQPIDVENGCLFVDPGTHKQTLQFHSYPNDGVVNRAYHGIHGQSSEKDAARMMPVVMGPGDTLFFHPLLVHGSGRNNSTRFRKAISVHYANSSVCQYIDVSGSMQQDIMDDIMSMAAIKMKGADISQINFVDIWKAKSRQATGKPANLE